MSAYIVYRGKVAVPVEARDVGLVCREVKATLPGVFLIPWSEVSGWLLREVGRAGLLSIRREAA